VAVEPIFLVLLAAVAVLLIVILIRLFIPAGGAGRQMLDLKNELADLKTRQLEGQTQSMARQYELYQQSQKLLGSQLDQTLRSLTELLAKSQGNINLQLASTEKVIVDVHQRLGTLSEAAKNIQEIGKDISSLQDILQAPKLRGNLGEYLLEDLLRQILPAENYAMKHSFKNGTQVDAIIKLGGSIIPIDSKFPLESFQRMTAADAAADKARFKKEFVKTVKARIDEIAGKYINPDEGTYDFALMYVPAENVFYEMIVTDELTDRTYEIFHYAVGRHVIPVSPNSFYSYLMAIAYGLRGFRIERQAKTIIGELAKVGDAFGAYAEDFTLLGKHIKYAAGKFDDCQKRVEKFGEQVARITSAAVDPDPEKQQLEGR
jgi:DNA recombination protein RmuC